MGTHQGNTVKGNRSDDKLGLGAGTAGMSSVRVAREFDLVVVLELQSLLEALANLGERLLCLFRGLALADRACPKTDTVKPSPHVDDDAHDLVIILVLEVLTDSREHDVEPQSVDVDGLLVLELEGPLAAVLVLRVLPLGSHTLLEEVIVGLERQFRCGGNVVLVAMINNAALEMPGARLRRCPRTPLPNRTR